MPRNLICDIIKLMILKEFSNQLEFSNDGKLSVFFIGTGNAFQKNFFQANILVIKGSSHVLIDCGTLCPYVLEREYNTKLSNIKNIILTHQHADHVGGVEELALSAYYVSKSPVNIAIPPAFKKTLWKESLRGGIQYSETGKKAFNDYFSELPIKRIQKKPFEMYESNIGSINVKFFRTRHVTSRKDSLKDSQISYGLIFDDRILFTGDTQYNPEQIDFILAKFPTIEHIFHDCDVSGFSPGVHAPYNKLKNFPPEIKKKMTLYHYNEKIKDFNAEQDGFCGFAKRGFYYIF